MSEAPDETEVSAVPQAEFEKISAIVTAEFPISESLLEHGIPTYYLGNARETKQPFLNVLKKLEKENTLTRNRPNQSAAITKKRKLYA